MNERSVIDLTHEALIRQWNKLKFWVDNEFQRSQAFKRWSQLASEWKDDSDLLIKGDLARALEWSNGPTSDCPMPLATVEPEKPKTQPWRPTVNWAMRYSKNRAEEIQATFDLTLKFIAESRDREIRDREKEKLRLEAEANRERKRAEKERELAEEALRNAKRAQIAEQKAILVI